MLPGRNSLNDKIHYFGLLVYLVQKHCTVVQQSLPGKCKALGFWCYRREWRTGYVSALELSSVEHPNCCLTKVKGIRNHNNNLCIVFTENRHKSEYQDCEVHPLSFFLLSSFNCLLKILWTWLVSQTFIRLDTLVIFPFMVERQLHIITCTDTLCYPVPQAACGVSFTTVI